jgi:hypothetical protein
LKANRLTSNRAKAIAEIFTFVTTGIPQTLGNSWETGWETGLLKKEEPEARG